MIESCRGPLATWRTRARFATGERLNTLGALRPVGLRGHVVLVHTAKSESQLLMLRTPLLYLAGAGWARRVMGRSGLAQRTARRFVAGEAAADAISVIRKLNRRGIVATLDHLGESVANESAAMRAADEYIQILGLIQETGLRSNVSIKLTQMGLDLDEAFCIGNARRIIERARAMNNFVRIDMEDSAHTDATLRVFHALRTEFEQVGIALQAYLYRTEADMRALVADGARVRLCKGAYKEPPDKAFPLKADVDANYIKLTHYLLEHVEPAGPAKGDGRLPPSAAIATHDVNMIRASERCASEKAIPRDRYEFQMLYGIRRELQDALGAKGHTVRVYVPYGTEWYPYFMRRLAERPANAWFFLSNLFRR